MYIFCSNWLLSCVYFITNVSLAYYLFLPVMYSQLEPSQFVVRVPEVRTLCTIQKKLQFLYVSHFIQKPHNQVARLVGHLHVFGLPEIAGSAKIYFQHWRKSLDFNTIQSKKANTSKNFAVMFKRICFLNLVCVKWWRTRILKRA